MWETEKDMRHSNNNYNVDNDDVATDENVPGLEEWIILDNAAMEDNINKTVKPKNTTAFNRIQTVCIFVRLLP